MAQARYLTPEQRAYFIDDSRQSVVCSLIDVGSTLAFISWERPEPYLPRWAYERLMERKPRWAELILPDDPFLPRDLRERLGYGVPARTPEPEPDLTREEAEALLATDQVYSRARAVQDPRVPADIAARFATDPAPEVRLAVSMRPGLTEDQRAAIDYHVAPGDRLNPVEWAASTEDPEVQRQCAYSAHIGLRRSVALNPHLLPELVPVLAEDDDFAVRLLLCEGNAEVTPERVIATYLEATTMTAGRLLGHPRLRNYPFARLADDPHPQARALVPRDPDAAPELIERLSHDEHPLVRAQVASDHRLSLKRVLELFGGDEITAAAAANPHLPVELMERILADADACADADDAARNEADAAARNEADAKALEDDAVEEQPAVYLGRWEPADEG